MQEGADRAASLLRQDLSGLVVNSSDKALPTLFATMAA